MKSSTLFCSLLLVLAAALFATTSPPANAQSKPELVVQLSHNGGVTSVAFSPKGSLLATSGGDGVIKIWDTRSHLLTREFLTGEGGFGGGGPAVAFSPSGKVLISAGKSVRFWDVKSGNSLRVIKNGGFDCLALSPDGRFLCLGGGEEVQIWNLVPASRFPVSAAQECNFKRQHVVSGLPSSVSHLAFSRSGLLAIGLNGEVRVISAVSAKAIYEFHGEKAPSGNAVAVAFAPDNSLVMAFNKVFVWNGASKTTTSQAVNLGFDAINTLGFSGDGKKLMVAGGDIRVLNWPASTLARAIESDEMPDISAAALSPDGALVATGVRFNDYSAQLWNARTGTLLVNWHGRNGGVNDVALSSDRRYLATATDDGPLRVWDLFSGRLTTVGTSREGLGGVMFSPNNRRVSDNGGNVWDVRTGHLVRRYGRDVLPFAPKIPFVASATKKPFEGFGGAIENYDLSPDGRFVAGAAGDLSDETLGAVEVWDRVSGKLLHRLTSEGGAVKAVRFLRDGTIVAGYEDGALRFWSSRTWTLRRTVPGHSAWINQLHLTPDGKHLLSAGNDYQVKVWNSASGAPEATLVILPPAKQPGFSKEWLVYTPNGLYSGSPGAEKFMRWRVGDTLFPAVWGRKFHRENLLKAILSSR